MNLKGGPFFRGISRKLDSPSAASVSFSMMQSPRSQGFKDTSNSSSSNTSSSGSVVGARRDMNWLDIEDRKLSSRVYPDAWNVISPWN
ncbi:hypothetical protein M0804_006052 [Polistes exclamans]|nr:hypothetical protein M0804_006052 [Polistes exclamans]